MENQAVPNGIPLVTGNLRGELNQDRGSMWPRIGPGAWTEDPGDKTGLLGDTELRGRGLVRGRMWGSRVKGVISRNILVGRDGKVAGGSGLMCWWPGHSGQNCAIAESAM